MAKPAMVFSLWLLLFMMDSELLFVSPVKGLELHVFLVPNCW